MRHHRLFAAGLAVALMLGAASPALADGKGKAKGKPNHGSSKPKPKPDKPAKKVKKTKAGVSGGGAVGTAEFSIQARLRDIKAETTTTGKGHFNYTSADGTIKIRCRGFDNFAPDYVLHTAAVPFKNCTVAGQPTVTTITVTVTDRGQPKYEAVPAVADHIAFVAGTLTVDSDLTGGNVKVR